MENDKICVACGTDYSVELYIKEGSKYNGERICQKHRNQLKNKSRLRAELKYYSEYPPQKHLMNEYNIESDDVS